MIGSDLSHSGSQRQWEWDRHLPFEFCPWTLGDISSLSKRANPGAIRWRMEDKNLPRNAEIKKLQLLPQIGADGNFRRLMCSRQKYSGAAP